jgi:hypothetical protein
VQKIGLKYNVDGQDQLEDDTSRYAETSLIFRFQDLKMSKHYKNLFLTQIVFCKSWAVGTMENIGTFCAK